LLIHSSGFSNRVFLQKIQQKFVLVVHSVHFALTVQVLLFAFSVWRLHVQSAIYRFQLTNHHPCGGIRQQLVHNIRRFPFRRGRSAKRTARDVHFRRIIVLVANGKTSSSSSVSVVVASFSISKRD
jgi:hypothetical protein